MSEKRFFPGPQGTEAEVVVPMTDFSVIGADSHRLPDAARTVLKERAAALRNDLQRHGFASGNKIASLMKLLLDESTPEDTRLMLYGGPTFRNTFRATLDIPTTPALTETIPQIPRALFEIISEQQLGGNASNILRNELVLARAGIGAKLHKVFTPRDPYLDPWMQPYLQDVGGAFEFHELQNLSSRYGAGIPFDDDRGREQRFSLNTPQDPTVEPMRQHVSDGKLKDCDFVVVSEGIGELLKGYDARVTQVFNPTSALHNESALEALKRFREGRGADMVFINDKEADQWLRIMENRMEMGAFKDLPEAKYPSPFQKSGQGVGIDANAIELINGNHRRWLNMLPPPETEYITCHSSIGCGPDGGQYLLQCQGKYYIACANTPTEEGARALIATLGPTAGVRANISDVIGAGDAALTASILCNLYTPLEDIIKHKDPQLSPQKLKIAAAAFHSFLGRIFGEYVYHSESRDLSGVPPEAMPHLLDMVLDKSIAAAQHITTVTKRAPQRIYTDPDWEMHFTMWELER